MCMVQDTKTPSHRSIPNISNNPDLIRSTRYRFEQDRRTRPGAKTKQKKVQAYTCTTYTLHLAGGVGVLQGWPSLPRGTSSTS